VVQWRRELLQGLTCCQSFTSHFNVFWPECIEFSRNDRVLRAEDWPNILKLTTRPQGAVTLKLKTL
jgi:hypothetical protein